MDKKFNIFLFFLIFLFCFRGYSKCVEKPITIGVIDSGFGYMGNGANARLCQMGHKDFTVEQQFFKETRAKEPVPLDVHGHGTNIVGIIENYANATNANFCIVILKYYMANSPFNFGAWSNMKNTVDAINYATILRLDFINYSGGGEHPSADEYNAIERFLNRGGTIVVAAGNEGVNLDNPHNSFYPAKYAVQDKRIIVVGMLDSYGVQSRVSNYGTVVTRWEIGSNVVGYGSSMSGTSQATAVATGKIVSKTKNRCE